MNSPTNTELAAQIKEVDKRSEKRHKSVLTTITGFKKEMRDQLQPFHDYLVGVEAVNKNKDTLSKQGNISIDPKVYDLIKWLILIVGTIVGVNKIG
jgi:phosphate uptake regulator